MKNKMITSLILTVFIAVLALCFIHTAMMMSPVMFDGCVLSAEQAMCPLRLMSAWSDLFVALPQINLTLSLLFLVSIIFFVFLLNKQINYEHSLKSAEIYSKTYPNFSSLNFLSIAFQRGILHPKIF